MEFELIVLRYEGLEAAEHRIDLGQIGHSLRGASQLLGTAASIVSTGEYAKRTATMPVRVLAGVPREGSWEIPAVIMSTLPAIAQQSLFIEMGKQLATKATTAVVNYALATFRKDKKVEELAMETVQKAMAEVGQTSRHAIDAVVRMSEQQRSAMRRARFPRWSFLRNHAGW